MVVRKTGPSRRRPDSRTDTADAMQHASDSGRPSAEPAATLPRRASSVSTLVRPEMGERVSSRHEPADEDDSDSESRYIPPRDFTRARSRRTSNHPSPQPDLAELQRQVELRRIKLIQLGLLPRQPSAAGDEATHEHGRALVYGRPMLPYPVKTTQFKRTGTARIPIDGAELASSIQRRITTSDSTLYDTEGLAQQVTQACREVRNSHGRISTLYSCIEDLKDQLEQRLEELKYISEETLGPVLPTLQDLLPNPATAKKKPRSKSRTCTAKGDHAGDSYAGDDDNDTNIHIADTIPLARLLQRLREADGSQVLNRSQNEGRLRHRAREDDEEDDSNGDDEEDDENDDPYSESTRDVVLHRRQQQNQSRRLRDDDELDEELDELAVRLNRRISISSRDLSNLRKQRAVLLKWFERKFGKVSAMERPKSSASELKPAARASTPARPKSAAQSSSILSGSQHVSQGSTSSNAQRLGRAFIAADGTICARILPTPIPSPANRDGNPDTPNGSPTAAGAGPPPGWLSPAALDPRQWRYRREGLARDLGQLRAAVDQLRLEYLAVEAQRGAAAESGHEHISRLAARYRRLVRLNASISARVVENKERILSLRAKANLLKRRVETTATTTRLGLGEHNQMLGSTGPTVNTKLEESR